MRAELRAVAGNTRGRTSRPELGPRTDTERHVRLHLLVLMLECRVWPIEIADVQRKRLLRRPRQNTENNVVARRIPDDRHISATRAAPRRAARGGARNRGCGHPAAASTLWTFTFQCFTWRSLHAGLSVFQTRPLHCTRWTSSRGALPSAMSCRALDSGDSCVLCEVVQDGYGFIRILSHLGGEQYYSISDVRAVRHGNRCQSRGWSVAL